MQGKFKILNSDFQFSVLSFQLKRGFTILEMLIAIAVLVILATIIIGAMANFRDSSEFNRAVDEVVAIIREARSKTLASEDGFQFGIHFESSRVVLFKGTSFVDSDPNNKVLTLSGRVEIFNINITGGNVVFERLTGDANPSGDVSVRLKNDLTNTETIIIGSGGLVYVQ